MPGDLGAHTLHGGQKTEPIFFGGLGESIKMNVIFTDMGFDMQLRTLTTARHARQGSGRTEYQISDSSAVDDDMAGAAFGKDAFQPRNHCRTMVRLALRLATLEWWAWQIAMANASAASGLSAREPGSNRATIDWT